MRSLATVQTIKALHDIPNKDRIKLAEFENCGYKCIVGTDYKVGDMVIYFEVDSLIPASNNPNFEFLRQRCYKAKYDAFHIKCMKMAGVFSEGLAWKPSDVNGFLRVKNVPALDGQDVTDLYGVKKYDPEAEEEAKLLEKKAKKYNWWQRILWKFSVVKKVMQWIEKKNRPIDVFKYIGKSDQTRYQALPYLFKKHAGKFVDVTVKLDGQSMTTAIIGGKITVASRNIVFGKKTNNRYTQLAESSGIIKMLQGMYDSTAHDYAVQSENCGVGIQRNKYGLVNDKSFVFDIKDLTTGEYLTRQQYAEVCRKYNVDTVPLLGRFRIGEGLIDVSNCQTYELNGVTLPHEGIVCRSVEYEQADVKMSNYFSFKVINENFMVKYFG